MNLGPRLLHAWLALCARMVPEHLRADWVREWKAEVVFASRSSSRVADQINLSRAVAGAALHALWLLRQDWRPEPMGQDLKHAIRSLVKQPLFSAVIVLTIGLGVGATTSVFSVVDGVLLERLPYGAPQGLVMVWEHNIPRDRRDNVVNPRNFMQWRSESSTLRAVAAAFVTGETVQRDAADPSRTGVVYTTPGFLDILQVRPHLGRLYDSTETSESVVVLRYGYWQSEFGGDPSVVGQTMVVDGDPVEIIGVLPRDVDFDFKYEFNSTGQRDIWMPMGISASWSTAGGRWMQVIGRMEPGVTVQQVQSELAAMARAQNELDPEFMAGWTINVVPLHTEFVGDVRTALLVILGSAFMVLLVAAFNVANLQLARGTTRAPEVAVRTALGASRSRVVRLLLTESMVLAVAGGVLGILIAYGATGMFLALAPADLPRVSSVGVDARVLAFALVASLMAGFVFGAYPAFRTSAADMTDTLREGTTRSSVGSSQARVRSLITVAEVAVAMVLLAGSGLLIRSFQRMLDVDLGMNIENVVTASVAPEGGYTDESRIQFFEQLVERLELAPGVQEASAITFLPMAGPGSATGYWHNDRPVPPAGDIPPADVRPVHRDYFRTMGIPILDGSTFDEVLPEGAGLKVIISKWAADTFYPDRSPVGSTITMPWAEEMVAEIVGVVGNVGHDGPDTEQRTKLYWDHRQFQPWGMMTLVVRSDQPTASVASTIRSVVSEMDSDLPVFDVRTMDSLFGNVVAASRFGMVVVTAFATVALILAVIGIYGVIAFSVSRRTREIGVRMALGAEASDVLKMVAGQGLTLVTIALAIGVPAALVAGRLMQEMLFEISPRDPVTLIGVSVLLGLVGIGASILPALRAARIDPTEALRQE